MCDYCDCRSQPEIAALSAEHERILEVVDALRRGIDVASPTQLDQWLDELTGLLAPHAQREEAGLFSQLREVGVTDTYVHLFEHDHTAIDEAIAAARADHRQIGTVADLVAHHIRDEETDMFPASVQIFSPADWERVNAGAAAFLASA